jgi:uncharacterized protein YdaU (DUF1376 family)
MAALPYIQLYVADYLADTAHLTTVEHGAYLLLIFNYWQKGESFKAKDERTLNKRLATVARMNEQEWENVKETLSEYFEITENEWFHDRIERDLFAVNSKSTKAKAAGKASAQKRATSKVFDNKEESNECSTNVPTNVPTNVQQTFNHTEAEADKDIKDISIEISSASAKKPKKEREVFKPPTLAEVCELVVNENLEMDASTFTNFYKSKGWMVGKEKMKCWRSAARGWSARNKKQQAQKSPESETNTNQGLQTLNQNSGINYATPKHKYQECPADVAAREGLERVAKRKREEALRRDRDESIVATHDSRLQPQVDIGNGNISH